MEHRGEVVGGAAGPGTFLRGYRAALLSGAGLATAAALVSLVRGRHGARATTPQPRELRAG